VLEIGADLSTRVILDALGEAIGSVAILDSISTDSREDVARRYEILPSQPKWRHYRGLTSDVLPTLPAAPLDLILHDGAHDTETVAADLAWALPRLRRFGLCLIHDTQHSNCGEAMRAAVRSGMHGRAFSNTTLPYGFGLTILRREDGADPINATACDKVSSPHRTEPTPL
ncbi:MAG: class I SAM-dependent methyltransferase, partial [Dehalococcoidia bacterium]|nr:class I SAM-dependent methyltransferase [Dehalococcoidia bacterium]